MISVAVAGALASCGGFGDADPEEAAPTVAAERAAAVAPVHSCMQRVTRALKLGDNSAQSLMDCLIGTYAGKTTGGEACSLRIAATQGQFRFARTSHSMSIERDDTAAPPKDRASHAMQVADVELGHVGLQLSRRGTSGTKVVETLVLNSGERSDGSSNLIEMTYERVQDGEVRIARCRFDQA
ncbi:hypothetical protein [Caldimonas sp. KR1-144]|uniref:hypothetical protein n=1 Tax=Caldimonas sp. KR1-144 TaxID=3400911 RepID=UPI003C0F0038